MEWLADRFLLTAHGGRHTRSVAIDLATGDRVCLVVSMQGGASEQARWAARCARLAALRHPSMATLVDYGAAGEVRRFEAWRGTVVDGTHSADATVRALAAFLALCGLTCGDDPTVIRDGPRLLALPDAAAGYDAEPSPSPAGVVPGLAIIARPSLAALAQTIAEADGHARALSIWGAPGAGVGTALLEVARAARLQGYVPISPTVASPDVFELLKGRSALVLAREQLDAAWRLWLDLSVRSRRRHLLVCASAADVRGTVPLVLERFPESALIEAVRPSPMPAAWQRTVAAAARDSKGLPAAFADRLWRHAGRERTPLPVFGNRVAEPRAEYGVDAGTEPTPAPSRRWPVPADLVQLRMACDRGAELVAGGHVARGERALREAIGGLARRDDWTHAATGALSLARALLTRGRGADAAAALAQTRDFAYRASSVSLMLQAAVVAGRHAVDQQQLGDAEAVLDAARATARALDDGQATQAVAYERARGLFWRGRFDEARDALGPSTIASAADHGVSLAALRTRIAIGLGALQEAIAQSVAATTAATGGSDDAQALAWTASAHAHLAVGDFGVAAVDVGKAIHAARLAHAPLRAIGARFLAAEIARQSGDRAVAARLVARFDRTKATGLPPLLRARLHLLANLLKDDGPDTVPRLVKASGLGGLAIFGPTQTRRAGSAALVASLLDILHCGHAADDDLRVLEQVCVQVKSAVGAVGVGVFLDERSQLSLVLSVGGRLEANEAARVQLRDDVAGPRAGCAPGSQGGAPIRWGGQTIGVLAAAWPCLDRDVSTDWHAILSAAAVVAAPALAAERVKRSRPTHGMPELLGSSAAMIHVRAAVERAAPAPFAVLIEGESGSGKELVARALHRRSARRDRGCCAVNCAALPDDLLESELFGHARGAFTGAMAERVGVFEEAHGGTLFLDEVGELSARAQAKLLRAIQEQEIRRVGENTPRRVDVRIVAATNRQLHDEARAGRFRQDLLYRLDVIRIVLPPLRERVEDIALLAEHFWNDAIARVGSRATLSVTTLAALARYDWPGNVRELQNVLAALAVRVPRRGVVPPSALPALFDGMRAPASWRLDDARRTFDASFVRAALARAGGHRSRAATELGLTRQGLAKLIARLGLEPDEARANAGVRASG